MDGKGLKIEGTDQKVPQNDSIHRQMESGKWFVRSMKAPLVSECFGAIGYS